MEIGAQPFVIGEKFSSISAWELSLSSLNDSSKLKERHGLPKASSHATALTGDPVYLVLF